MYKKHVKSTSASLLNQSKIYKIKTALPYRQVHDGPKSKQFLKKQFQPSSRLFRIFRRPESRETEISLAARSKPFSGRSHYLDFIKQVIKKLPASHSIRAFHPNIRSVFPSAVPDAEPIQYFRQTSSILFIDLNPLPNLPLSFFRKYSRSSFLDKIHRLFSSSGFLPTSGSDSFRRETVLLE